MRYSMLKKTATVLVTCLALAACSSDTPRILQAVSDMPEVRLTPGMATQIEMPNSGHVQSIVVGNPSLVTAERADSVVNLVPKAGYGDTNLIVRSVDEDGRTKVYQYRVVVQQR